MKSDSSSVASLLVRLEHQFDTGEDKDYSRPLTVDLDSLFANLVVVEARETLLGANIMSSTQIDSLSDGEPTAALHSITTRRVTLEPMQIRTFILTVRGLKAWRDADAK